MFLNDVDLSDNKQLNVMKTTKRKIYSQEHGWLEEVSYKILGFTLWREISYAPPVPVDESLVISAMRNEAIDFSKMPNLTNEAFDKFQEQQIKETWRNHY